MGGAAPAARLTGRLFPWWAFALFWAWQAQILLASVRGVHEAEESTSEALRQRREVRRWTDRAYEWTWQATGGQPDGMAEQDLRQPTGQLLAAQRLDEKGLGPPRPPFCMAGWCLPQVKGLAEVALWRGAEAMMRRAVR